MNTEIRNNYQDRIQRILSDLGISSDYEDYYGLSLQQEALETDLVSAGKDVFDREQFLLPLVEKHWRDMRQAARNSNVTLDLISCFRSVNYQRNLIEKKLIAGRTMDNILQVSAAPGYSEHHTGRAIDIATDDCDHLTEEFDGTEAFQWLLKSAESYGFYLSYPKDNTLGIAYEPWHWLFKL